TRAQGSFKLDSHRQIWRVTNAMVPLNGQLIKSESEALVSRLSAETYPDPLPRDIVLELTTERATNPIFRPNRAAGGTPRQLSTDLALRLFKECSMLDDVRLTLAGVGDPMLAETIFNVLEAAVDSGVSAIRIE